MASRAILVRNSLVQECLLDMADRDYLAARICWRNRLPEQFLWSALQCVEKSLKTILLLNDKSARTLSHDVEKALTRVDGIADLRFSIQKEVREFIGYLNRFGQNRYLERGFYMRGMELMALDKTYWYLRRYCWNIRAHARTARRPEAELLTSYAKYFRDQHHLDRPMRFHLFTGYLENTLAGKNGREQYRALVWKNVFFGKREKGTFSFSPMSWSASPAHFRYPDVFDELSKIIDFPADVRQALSRRRTR
jgi:HEPN domain-containing protein